MDPQKMNKVLSLFSKVYAIPNLLGGKILSASENGIKIETLWSNRNLERKSKQKYIQIIFLNSNLQPLANGFPIDCNTEAMSAYTADEKFRAVVRELVVDGKTKQFVEIWDSLHLMQTLDLAELDEHGSVYTDDTFGALHWSPDNKRLLYVAEKKLPKVESFYKRKSKSKSQSDEQPIQGMEYAYKADWGEQLVGKHQSIAVVLNVEEESINPLTSIPEEYFPGSLVWAPNGVDVVGVVFKREPMYLGLYACTNRESYIFYLKGTEFRILSSEKTSCAAPRFSPNGKHLVWLERDLGPAHHDVHRLMHLQWDSENPGKPLLIDVVKKEAIINQNKKFYGIYSHSLPTNCWSKDSKYLFFNTPQRHNVQSYVVNLETKNLTEIENAKGYSNIILDVKDDFVLFSRLSILKPSQLHIAKFDPTAKNIGNLDMTMCLTPNDVPDGDSLWYEHTEYIYENADVIKDFNFAYLGKKDIGKDDPSKRMPLILVPHGGPHSQFTNIFQPSYTLFALLGFGVLYVNFRGSTGMGGDNVEYLLGKVGDADVVDCITALDVALKKYPWIDPTQVNACGGSHGGFLSAHLSGQYPDRFRSIVLLNPVIDLSSMYSTTDIPDWCQAEIGCSKDILSDPRNLKDYSDYLQKMLEHSPIIHVDKVKAPTLIAVGTEDLRVPAHQGKLWYNRLVKNNVKAKLFVYADNHSLRKDNVEVDNVINIALWFLEHNNI